MSEVNRKRKSRLDTLRANLKKVLPSSSLSIRLSQKQGDSQKFFPSDCSNPSEEDLSSRSELEITISPQHQVAVSDSFHERYSLGAKLGEGCNGCVYQCVSNKNGRTYAVKKQHVQEQELLVLKKNFIHMRQLQHDAIISYRALFFDDSMKTSYLVMQYLENYRNLGEICKQLEESQLKRIIKLLLGVIQYLHNRNICHRDIKPDNIMVHTDSHAVKLIDFGISKKTYQRGTRRQMLTVIGTPFYLAPQMLLGGGYDERIDLWALGITTYYVVTGSTPFQSEYRSDTVKNIIEGKVKLSGQQWEKKTSFLRDFVLRLLKPVEVRMTLSQACSHLWVNEGQKRRRLQRLSSQITTVHQDFHQEMKNNFYHASSREQGQRVGQISFRKRSISSLCSPYFEDKQLQDQATDEQHCGCFTKSLRELRTSARRISDI